MTGTVVPLGVAIYVAGAGVLLALLGGRTMRTTAAAVPAVEPEATTRCPAPDAPLVLPEAGDPR